MADICVSVLRTNAGRDPLNKGIHDLVGELSTRSEEFRHRWAAHNVRHHGTKHFHHRLVGDITLAYEGMQLVADPNLTFTVYTAEPDSPSHDALRLLATLTCASDSDTHPREGLVSEITTPTVPIADQPLANAGCRSSALADPKLCRPVDRFATNRLNVAFDGGCAVAASRDLRDAAA